MDLTNAYNLLLQEKNDGYGGYNVLNSSNLPVDPLVYLNEIEFYQKFFFFTERESSIPAYFINYDKIKKDNSAHDFEFQFFSDRSLNYSRTVPNCNFEKGGYNLKIHNLGLSSIVFGTPTTFAYNDAFLDLNRIKFKQNNVIQATFPLLLIPRSTSEETPTISKNQYGELIYGDIEWSNKTDTYVLSNDQSNYPYPDIDICKIKFGWMRKNNSTGKYTRYALSEGQVLVHSGTLIGAFEGGWGTTVSYDGTNIDMDTESAGIDNPNLDWQLYAPTLNKVKINGTEVEYTRIGDYVFKKSDELWDFVGVRNGGGSAIHPLVTDINNDGNVDIILFTNWGKLHIDHGPIFGWWDDILDYPDESEGGTFFVGNFDTDNLLDIGFLDNDRNLKIDYQNNGFTGWELQTSYSYGDGTIVIGDFNNDNRDDISIKPYYFLDFIDYSSNGFGNWDATFYVQYSGYSLKGDFDGDQKDDIVILKNDLKTICIDYSSNNFGSFDKYIYLTSHPVDSYKHMALCDYDGDGKTDVGYLSNNTWYIKKSSQNYSTYNSWINYSFNINDIPFPADYDNDGKINPGLKIFEDQGKFKISYKTEHVLASMLHTIQAQNSIEEESFVFPNPFNPNTNFKINLKESSNIVIRVFNIKGQKVFEQKKYNISGQIVIPFNGNNLSSGTYLYSILINKKLFTGKMLLLK